MFELIIPVYRTTKKIKKGFGEMHTRMQEQMNQKQNPGQSSSKKPAPQKKAGDYIDFEEIK